MATPPNLRNVGGAPPVSKKGPIALAVVIVLLVLIKSMAVVVPAGARGVLFNKFRGGVQDVVLDEGMHFINPLATTMTLFNVRTETYTMSDAQDEGQVRGPDGIEAKTEDGQRVTIDISLRYHVNPDSVAKVYRDVGVDYEAKLVLPTMRSATRNIFAQYPVDAVYSEQREVIAATLTSSIAEGLAPNGLVVDEFLLRNIGFSPEYAAAIENKQIEQQNDQRKKHEVDVARKEAERRRIEAEGEAKANDIRGQALGVNPQIVQYEYIRKVSPNIKVLLIDSNELRHGVLSGKPVAP